MDKLGIEPVREARQSAADHLAACIRGEQSPVASVDDARTNLALCLDFYRAARTGMQVMAER